MMLITLPAHFDGKKICLDEPFNLLPNTKLIVTIIPEENIIKTDNHHEGWLNLSEQRLVDAYGANEPEYSSNLLKEVNPDFEGR
ncbi:MAG: hypothetical protein HQK66_03425 [Desulfamplus sp.]|nr:hypothetical protein [Desulfamplus sp.]